MDWKLSLATFGAVFLAELGDKTQLATFALAGGGRSKLAVFIGAASALVLTSALAVVGADLVSRWISQQWLHRISGALLVALGAWLLFTGE
jgi:putative Ca2+/H+ antiporter (TMEM165/GDT1 family)